MNFKSRLASLHNSCPFTTAHSLDLLFECINHSLAIKFMSKKKRCTIASSSFLPAWKFSQFLIQPSSFSSFWRFPSQTPGSLMAVFHKLSCVHKMKLLEILAKHRSCFPNVWVEARDFPFLISSHVIPMLLARDIDDPPQSLPTLPLVVTCPFPTRALCPRGKEQCYSPLNPQLLVYCLAQS